MVCHWSAQNQNLKVADLDDMSEYSHAADWWLFLQIVYFVPDVSLEGRHMQ